MVEDRDLDLNEKKDIRFNDIREYHCRDIAVENDDKKKIPALRWDVNIREKEELITREFLVSVPPLKGETIV